MSLTQIDKLPGFPDQLAAKRSQLSDTRSTSPAVSISSDKSDTKAQLTFKRLEVLSQERKDTKIKADVDVRKIVEKIDQNMDTYFEEMNFNQLAVLNNFIESCQAFISLPYAGTSQEVLRSIIDKMTEYSNYFDRETSPFNPATKVLFIISPLLRFNIEEDDVLIDRRETETPDVNQHDIAEVMKKSMQWKDWGDEWIKDQKESHQEEEQKQPEKNLLLCRICEQKIEASKMKEHNITCSRNMLVYSSNYTIRKLLKQLSSTVYRIDNCITTQSQLSSSIKHEDLVQGKKVLSLILSYMSMLVNQDESLVDVTSQRDTMLQLQTICKEQFEFPIIEVASLCENCYDALTQRLKILETTTPDVFQTHNMPSRTIGKPSIRDFQLLKPISRGAYGKVFLARKITTGDLYAIKTMNKRELIRKNQTAHIQAEQRIMSQANNPFVVKLYYSFQSRNHLYLVMEFINGGDLFSMLQNLQVLPEEMVIQYGAEIVLALEYLHDTLHVVHRDLKPDNILISNTGHLKLTDFGLSQIGVAERHAERHDDDTIGGTRNRYDSSRSFFYSSSGSNSGSNNNLVGFNSSVNGSPNNNDSFGLSLNKRGLHTITATNENDEDEIDLSEDDLKLIKNSNDTNNSDTKNVILSSKDINTIHSPKDTSTNNKSKVENTSSNSRGNRSPEPMSYYGRERFTTHSGGFDLGNPYKNSNDNNFLEDLDEVLEIVKTEENTDKQNKNKNINDESQDEQTKHLLENEELNKKRKERFFHTRKDHVSQVGTPDYMAPELLLGIQGGPCTDWWSFGVILYELLIGFPPFNDSTPEKIFDKIIHKRMAWPNVPEEMSPEAYNLIDGLLDLNPDTRLGSKGTYEIKEHPFFLGVDWDALSNELTDACFVPEVTDKTDTSYFISRHQDGNDASASFQLSLDRTVPPTSSNGVSSIHVNTNINNNTTTNNNKINSNIGDPQYNESMMNRMNSISSNSSNDSINSEDDEFFTNFDYSNVFSLQGINNDAITCNTPVTSPAGNQFSTQSSPQGSSTSNSQNNNMNINTSIDNNNKENIIYDTSNKNTTTTTTTSTTTTTTPVVTTTPLYNDYNIDDAEIDALIDDEELNNLPRRRQKQRAMAQDNIDLSSISDDPFEDLTY
ncbi:hypothetical protein WA158_005662 [Blastocystis sp. Blastoise]